MTHVRPHPAPSARVDDAERTLRALRTALRDAMVRHKQLGTPMVVWRDGKVTWVEPDEFPMFIETNDV